MSFRSVMRRVRRWLGLNPQRKNPLQQRIDHLKLFVNYEPAGERPPINDTDLSRLRIAWVIPDFIPGAGGHMTIFRIAHHLERFGHQIKFLVQNPSEHKTAADVIRTINTHFQPFHGEVELFEGHTPDASGDALIATDRFTCYPVEAMRGFNRKFYFVQDFEAAFYPAGTEALLTEATYHFEFDCLCAGDWLHHKMSTEFGRWSMSWPLAYDSEVYSPGPAHASRHPARIAVYARYVTPRRAVELAFLALEILHRRGLKFEVDFFGWQLGEINVPYPYRDCGILSGDRLASLYREATVGVVFSATNHSLVNKEMMACALPVIDLDIDTVRSIFPEDVLAFAKPTPEGIADALEMLLKEPQERERLRRNGLSYVRGLSWEKSARMIEGAIKERVQCVAGGGESE